MSFIFHEHCHHLLELTKSLIQSVNLFVFWQSTFIHNYSLFKNPFHKNETVKWQKVAIELKLSCWILCFGMLVNAKSFNTVFESKTRNNTVFVLTMWIDNQLLHARRGDFSSISPDLPLIKSWQVSRHTCPEHTLATRIKLFVELLKTSIYPTQDHHSNSTKERQWIIIS